MPSMKCGLSTPSQDDARATSTVAVAKRPTSSTRKKVAELHVIRNQVSKQLNCMYVLVSFLHVLLHVCLTFAVERSIHFYLLCVWMVELFEIDTAHVSKEIVKLEVPMFHLLFTG